MTLEQRLVNMLIDKGFTVSFAESCTGGMCCSRLVNVSNASKVLNASFVTYANDAKIKFLGVSGSTIASYGVVSENVAEEMARSVAKVAESNVGVAITGIAGPTGGTDKKPVGTVCFGFCINGKCVTYTKHFGNVGRNEVRALSVEFVYTKLVELLGDCDEKAV